MLPLAENGRNGNSLSCNIGNEVQSFHFQLVSTTSFSRNYPGSFTVELRAYPKTQRQRFIDNKRWIMVNGKRCVAVKMQTVSKWRRGPCRTAGYPIVSGRTGVSYCLTCALLHGPVRPQRIVFGLP